MKERKRIGQPKGKTRRRNASATRAAILGSARQLFSEKGYENVGVREIASQAGVSATLVNRYFGSKENLFREAISGAFTFDPVDPDAAAELGKVFARYIVTKEPASSDGLDPLMILLRSVSNPGAAERLLDTLTAESLRPLSRSLPGKDADLRAAVTLSCVIGLSFMRMALKAPSLNEQRKQRLQKLLQRMFDAILESPQPKNN